MQTQARRDTCSCGIESSQYLQVYRQLSHVFTHVLEDPNDDICKLTRIAKSRCMNRPRERSDGLRSLAAFGDLFAADHAHIDRRT